MTGEGREGNGEAEGGIGAHSGHQKSPKAGESFSTTGKAWRACRVKAAPRWGKYGRE